FQIGNGDERGAVRQKTLAGLNIRHNRARAKVHSLARPLVIYEEKRAIFVNWSAQRSAELVTPIGRPAAKIKKVRFVERAVGVVAISRTVELIASGAGDRRNNGPRGAAILRVARPLAAVSSRTASIPGLLWTPAPPGVPLAWSLISVPSSRKELV